MSFIVAIDGPAGSGKGTITKRIEEELGLTNIDTGAMFRCVALDMINKNVSIKEEEKISDILNNINIELKLINDENKFFLNGIDVSKEIRSKEVTELVSPISTLRIVREKLLKLQRDMAIDKDIIMEGRDIGTTVFPNADVKIYLDATPEERARRRLEQNKKQGIDGEYNDILEKIKERDKRDQEREISPLKKAEDAIYIDTTLLNIDEVVEKIVTIIKEKRQS